MFKLSTLFTLGLVGVATVSGLAIPRAPEPCDETAVTTGSTGSNATSETTTTWTTDASGNVILDINGTLVNPADKHPPSGWAAGYLEVNILQFHIPKKKLMVSIELHSLSHSLPRA